jgi:hypothetical protein
MKVGYHNLKFFTIVFTLQADKFDGKHERRVGRDDSAESAGSYIERKLNEWGGGQRVKRTVCQIGRNRERAFLVDAHPEETFVPAANDLSNTDYAIYETPRSII